MAKRILTCKPVVLLFANTMRLLVLSFWVFSCDVTDREKILELAKTVKENVGVVSILINNAGIMPTHPLLQQTESEIKKTFDINVFAHFWVKPMNKCINLYSFVLFI